MSKFYSFQTNSSAQTKKLAGLLSREVLKNFLKKQKKALIFALSGDLGSGKTTFVQGFIRSLGIKRKITSPTFVIVKSYKLKVKSYKKIYHIDCYRIQKPTEILNLGLKEVLENPKNIILIEWAEKIKKILAEKSIWIKFKHGQKINQRIVKFIRKQL